MKKKTLLLVFSFIALTALCISGAAFGNGAPAGSCPLYFIWATPNVPGQQWSGTATLYFSKDSSGQDTVNWFVRIGKGKNLAPGLSGVFYGGSQSPPYYCTSGTYPACSSPGLCSDYTESVQYQLLENAGPEVVDALGYPAGTPIALQSFSNLVQGADFWMFDFVVAIDGKIQK